MQAIETRSQRNQHGGDPSEGWGERIAWFALILVPIAIVLELIGAPATAIFIISALAVIPLARLLGQETEAISAQAEAGLGAFLNASFGNAAELIIGFFALRAGLPEVVKASLTGAIIGNILLVTGFAFLLGGLRVERQTFNKTAIGLNATLLYLSAIGLLIPAVLNLSAGGGAHVANLSLEISVVLIAAYFLSLIFSFRTHRHLYRNELAAEEVGFRWSLPVSVVILIVASGFIALMSEFLVGAIRPAAQVLGMTDIFLGVVFVAIIGNAAEHSTAVTLAIKDKMDVSLGIALGSSQQVALFVAPLLVFIGHFIGKPMNLLFTPLEVAAVAISVIITGFVAADGESNWMEGVLLIAVYIILAIAFYFVPA